MRNHPLRSAIISLLVTATLVFAFIVIDDTHNQTVGGIKTHVFPVIGSVDFATLDLNTTAADGEMQYCTDCQRNTEPCQGVGSGAMAIRRAGMWECLPGGGTCSLPTPSPLAFGTDGIIPIFQSTPGQFGSYAGAICPTPGMVSEISAAGGVTCITPTPGAGADTPTPIPTETPFGDLLYDGKLNMGANLAGTPLGRVNITAAATPAAHDRIIICTVGTATPTPAIYTMPAATGSGRVIDMISAGAGPCQMDAGSDFMNDGHAELFPANTKWSADTCMDIASGQWACRNMGTPTPTP